MDAAWRQIVRLRAQPDLAFPILGLGVDRLDYTKGIVHRFEAIERFLEKYPEYQGRFGFVQIAVPSRTQIEDYRRVKAQVECAVERINTRFGIGTAKPIHYRYAHLEPAELVAYYRMADFAMVTSLHDGMNLVAKEFVASQVEQRGVLICSEFAGAAEALDTALLINPYDTERVADTLKHAIEMSREEKAHRMARLQMHIAEHNIYKWLADIFTTLEHIQGASDGAALAAVEAPGGGLRCCMSEWCALYGCLVSRTVMGLTPKSQGSPLPLRALATIRCCTPGRPWCRYGQSNMGRGPSALFPASAGRHGAACHPTRPRHPDRLDHGPVHRA